MEEENKLIEHEYKLLLFIIKNQLTDLERNLILFVFYKNNTLTNYAYHENISYVTASKRKKKVLEKLNTLLKHGSTTTNINISSGGNYYGSRLFSHHIYAKFKKIKKIFK